MNIRNSGNRPRNNSSGGARSVFEEIYRLGYDHGFNDASRDEDYDDDFSDYENDYDDYELSNNYDDEDDENNEDENKDNSRGNQQRKIHGKSTSVGRSGNNGSSRRGFASMSKTERTRIARMGGQASHSSGKSSGSGRSYSKAGFGGRKNNA